MTRGIAQGTPAPRSIRCAIYTRKSTEEGLQQEFNSLDAQRESGQAYVASQQHEGWVCLPEPYDDGGYSGGDVDRPALQQLLVDIEAGKIDCVVVYKVDRLSRSLLDFARLMETFERHRVTFVSVTQAFSTTHSMGRLTLNILLSFAQFEREIISERTRDKIAATRRKGKWSGGRPILGYDVVDTKLVVNETEAVLVRKIFDLYLQHGALIPTVRELNRRGCLTKKWVTRRSTTFGGVPFDKGNLYNLLTNVAYVGMVRYKTEVHPGEQTAIVDQAIFDDVQALLHKNHRAGGAEVRNRFGALLKTLLRCVPCDCGMAHSHSTKGAKRYRYYVCNNAQKRGAGACPSGSVSAPEIERFVVDQIRAIGRDPALAKETLAQTRAQGDRQLDALEKERQTLERDLARFHNDLRNIATSGPGETVTAELADLQEQVRSAERRLSETRTEIAAVRNTLVDEHELKQAIAAFDPVWDALSLREQARVMQLLIERVEYDGRSGDVVITFHSTGIRTLAQEVVQSQEDAA